MGAFRPRLTTVTLVVAVGSLIAPMLLGGCGAVDRAGGRAGQDTTTLTLAQPNTAPPAVMLQFADEVYARSRGALRIRFKNARHHADTDAEAETIAEVQAGTFDIGGVGARAFDQVGVTSFQALLAPMLIDSQALQRRVFESGIPKAMMAGLRAQHLVGVAVFPGPLRKLMSKGRPLTSPGAFAGKNIGVQESAVARETFSMLGATPTALAGGGEIDAIDGADQQLSSILGNLYVDKGARNVVGNINMWPRPLVLFMNADAYAGLDDSQRGVLADAYAATLSPALDAARAEDTNPVASLCTAGLRMVNARPAQVTALSRAVAPVYDKIATHQASAGWLARIRELKAELDAPPDTASCAASAKTDTHPGGLPDGTYRTVLARRDYHGCENEEVPARQLLEAVVHGDSLKLYTYRGATPDGPREIGFSATYSTFRDTLEMNEVGIPLVFEYTFDGHALVLSDLRPHPEHCLHAAVWTSHPWLRD